MRVFRSLCLLFVVSGLLSGCSKFVRLQKSGDVDAKYEGALKFFENKDYYHAGLLFEELMPLMKGTQRAETSQYYFAYCHFYEKQYGLSAFYFKNFYETYPRSEFAEEASYMEALSYFEDSPSYELDQGNTMEAMRAIQTFLTEYPTSERKDDCNYMVEKLRDKLIRKAYKLAQLYYAKQDYQAAIIAFGNFAKDYPESVLQETALSYRVQAAYNLARASIPSKQADRYTQVVNVYENFLNRFPASQKLREVETYYAQAQAWLKTKSPAKPALLEGQSSLK